MTTWLFFLFLSVALALGGIREDSPKAQSRHQMLADIKSAGWRRVVLLAVQALFGAALVMLAAAGRTGVYHLAMAVAAGASYVASVAALDQRPVRVRRQEIRA